MNVRSRPVGGPLLTPVFKIMLVLWAIGTAAGVVRWTQGLGAATALNDAYPWGLWIAFDVVVGTGLASGGYAIALLVFIFNRGKYHPLVRPALLTSALGYSIAGVAVFFDVGRYWNLWKIPVMPWNWNGTSVLLEVALCMMAYVAVLLVELSPALLERWRSGASPGLAAVAEAWLPRLERALPLVIAAGLVLPTMHQSSLGALLLIAPTKVHPLYYTGLMPALYLLTCFGMGYAVIYFESIFSSLAFDRPIERKLLGSLGRVAGATLLAFVAIRFGGLALEGKLPLAFRVDFMNFFFWSETALLVAAAAMFLRREAAGRASLQLQAALLALAGGALYRIDTYLVAFNPGRNWSYFPSLGEIAVTLGLVATESMVYMAAVRRFPILAGVVLPEREEAPAAGAEVAVR